MLLLKKMFKKTTNTARSQNILAVAQKKRRYMKHPQRSK